MRAMYCLTCTMFCPWFFLQVVPVPRQALAAATLAVEPEQGADGKKDTSVKLCDKMVR